MQATNAIDATTDLVQRDKHIPGLGLLLDPVELLKKLSANFDCGQVEGIQLVYLRYKPGMNCLARYELTVSGQVINAYAKAHGEGAGSKMSKAMERPVISGKLGPGRVVLERQRLVFSTFPNDAKLPSLQCLVDADYRHRLFERLFGTDSIWADSSIGPALNYKPERRYVTKLTAPGGQSALLKFYSLNGYAKARTISRKLGVNRDDFYPETLGRSKKHATIAYAWQPGETLRQLRLGGRFCLSDLVTTAESLAEFHRSGRGGISRLKKRTEAKRLNALAKLASVLMPQLQHRLKAMALQLANWRKDQPVCKQPVHGDFYDKQVIVCNGKASLIDLDAVRQDDPLLDLGSYIAHLERQVIGHNLDAAVAEQHKEVLVKAYGRAASGIVMETLNKYTALGLFDLIHQPFRDWAQDWPAQTELLLERVEVLFSA